MKKLLLLSLLVLGAKSFAAIHKVGTTTDVQLPVVVTGNVIDNADTKLVIESDTVGMSGDTMNFVFDQVIKGGTAGAQGTFTLRRANNSALASAGMGSEANQLQIGFGSGFAQTVDANSNTVGSTGVKVGYELLGALEGNVYNGTIKVSVDATSGNVGAFEDRSQALHAKVADA